MNIRDKIRLLLDSGEWEKADVLISNVCQKAESLQGISILRIDGDPNGNELPTSLTIELGDKAGTFINAHQLDLIMDIVPKLKEKCHKCKSKGQIPYTHEHEDSVHYRNCRECDGTGETVRHLTPQEVKKLIAFVVADKDCRARLANEGYRFTSGKLPRTKRAKA